MKGIPTNTKRTQKPYRKEVFESYLIWRSVQGFMGQTKAQEVVRKAGGSNVQLFSIRNQTEFAKTYSVENSTLTNWNKLIDREDLLKDVLMPAKRLTRNVIFSLYRNILANGRANEVRLWLQLVESWNYTGSRYREKTPTTVAKITYATT